MPTRILIADDHAVFRSGLRALLEKEPDLEIVGETGNGLDTIRAVAENEVDVLLLDITMPGLPGAKVAEAVLKEEPHPAIVVLTMHEDEYYLQEFFRLGVPAYVLKKSTATHVVQAVRAVRRGEEYIDPALTGLLVSSDVGRRQSRERETGRLDLLTAREQEVLSLLAYGHTNGEIGQRLSISERTVETHRMNIMAKLDLTSRAELVRFAIDNGLLKFG